MAVACVLGLLRVVGHMALLALLLNYIRVTILLQWRWLVITSLSLDLSMDILITASLCYYFWRIRSEHARINSDDKCGEHTPDDIVFNTNRPWVSLFSNAMLASLNGRDRFRGLDDVEERSSKVTTLRFLDASDDYTHSTAILASPTRARAAIRIPVDVEKTRGGDRGRD
ncbi:hypothetical protein C8F04DRAFT_1187318 [Mycena alexandri]|uniref:Transmembrane protein n=1 Tax=Mycena alexandri TaxID=1745969 RepID=A0AAD6SMD2_9AGAR|nr:hypothetical protein C8F04DRAFT_1187318 [Mycena alexandri]